MGWLIRYTGKAADIVPPGSGEEVHFRKGDVIEVTPSEAMSAVDDPNQPWERVWPTDADYIAPSER